MKKTNFFLLLFLSFAICANAQYDKQASVLSAGIGLGSSLGSFTYGTQSPAFSVQYEHGVAEAGPGVISAGGYLGYKSYSYTYTNSYKAKWTYTIIGVRGAYHYTGFDIPKLDVYAGVMLAYNLLHYSDNMDNTTYNYGSNVGVSVYAGGRYYFAKKLGVFAEVGYGVAYLNVGVSLKF